MKTYLLIFFAIFFSSCDKKEDTTTTTDAMSQGKIVGYLKCNERETSNTLLGFFIISNKKDSLLSFNVPLSIYDLDTDNLINGINFWDGDSVQFNYRNAELDERKVFDCSPSSMLNPTLYDTDNFRQIVITKIERIQ